MIFSFEKWFEETTKNDTILKYSGNISSDVVNKTLDDIEVLLQEQGLSRKKIKRAYNAIVEGVQNLYHHSIKAPDSENEEKFGAYCIKVHNDEIDIITGNYITFNVVQIIKDRIDQINILEKDDLKALYKKILSNQEFSDKGGGGLGMVDIAKRTGSKLQYSFFDFDEKYTFFELKVNV
jgi:hypothetical protein